MLREIIGQGSSTRPASMNLEQILLKALDNAVQEEGRSSPRKFEPIQLHCKLGNTYFRGFWTLQIKAISNDRSLQLLREKCDPAQVIVPQHADLMWDAFTVGKLITSFSDEVNVHAYTKELLMEFSELLHSGIQALNSQIKPPPCAMCNGSGRASEACPVCSGKGEVKYMKRIEKKVICPSCAGKGYTNKFLFLLLRWSCSQCNGAGKVTDVKFDHNALKDCPDCNATGKTACSECS